MPVSPPPSASRRGLLHEREQEEAEKALITWLEGQHPDRVVGRGGSPAHSLLTRYQDEHYPDRIPQDDSPEGWQASLLAWESQLPEGSDIQACEYLDFFKWYDLREFCRALGKDCPKSRPTTKAASQRAESSCLPVPTAGLPSRADGETQPPISVADARAGMEELARADAVGPCCPVSIEPSGWADFDSLAGQDGGITSGPPTTEPEPESHGSYEVWRELEADPVCFADEPEPGPREWIIPDFLPRFHPVSLFGSGGAGKSYLALLAAICIASGQGYLDRPATKAIRPVLYLDFEFGKEDQQRRAHQIARGLGIPMPRSLMYRDFVGYTLLQVKPLIEQWLGRYPNGVLILDSFGPACGKDTKDDKDILPFMNAVRSLRAEGLLIVDHDTKTGSGTTSPYGNVYKANLSRQVWKAELAHQTTGEADVSLTRHKNNLGMVEGQIEVSIHFLDNRGQPWDEKTADPGTLPFMVKFETGAEAPNGASSKQRQSKASPKLTAKEQAALALLPKAPGHITKEEWWARAKDGMSKSTFYAVVHRLEEKQAVKTQVRDDGETVYAR